ncbi:MAG TPA: hypothetical protein VHE30_15555 [Polyangiaceae bacterium]|nr:hypothetical protein [Polyangiaceae bacterium]
MTLLDRKREGLGDAMLAGALGVLVFVRSAGFSFVYDDRWTIVQNRFLAEPLRVLLSSVFAGTAGAAGMPDATRPSMVVSSWLDIRLFGFWPFGHHLHSLLLYGLVVFTAALAARSLLSGDRFGATLAGVFFAVAPLHAEVVSAVNYREDLIAAFGVLVPLFFSFREDRDRDGLLPGVLVALAFLWGLFGKESAAVLALLIPAVLLLRGDRRALLASRERTLFLLGAVLLFWLNFRLGAASRGEPVPLAAPAPFATRLADTARYEVRALLAALAPIHPRTEYPVESHASAGYVAAFALIVLGVVALARVRALRGVAIGVTIALVAPLASSPLVGPVNPRADRYLFLAVFGGAIVFGAVGSLLVRRFAAPLVLAAAAVVLVPLAVFGDRACAPWHDERTLWERAVVATPESPRALSALARVERLAGNLDRAMALVDRALSIDPRHVQSHLTRTYVLLARGDVVGARAELGELDRLGGPPHPGLARARFCASRPADEARLCATFRDNPGPGGS